MRRLITLALAALTVLAVMIGAVGSASGSSLDRERYRRALRSAHPRVRACAQSHDLPPGRYSVRIEIDPDGRARSVSLEDGWELAPHAAASCIRSAFVEIPYPAPAPDTVTVVWPFTIVD